MSVDWMPGTTGWATVLGHDDVYGMWQERVDGVEFFVFAAPVEGTLSQHWLNVSNFRAWQG